MSEWRPIETAPKDGTTVIVARNMGENGFGWVRGYARWESAAIAGMDFSGWISQGFTQPAGNLGLAHPTHWMPLPAPPSPASDPSQVEAFQGED